MCDAVNEQGWHIFQSFVEHCRLPDGGFASIRDVDELPVVHEDRMETFWIVRPLPPARILLSSSLADSQFDSQSETLKYLYLLFSEAELVPIDKYVFNTEAHLFKRFTPTVEV